MRIRFEVARGRSQLWPHFLERAKRLGLYTVRRVARATLHVVVVEGPDAALELWQLTRSWKGAWYYVDGRAVGPERFGDMMRRHQFRDVHAREMLAEVIGRAHRERGRGA